MTSTDQPISGQPHSGQPHSGQPQSGQPHFGQPQSGQAHSGQPQSGTSRPLRLQRPVFVRPDGRVARLIDLAEGALNPPPGRGRIALALAMGLATHAAFAAAVLAMILAMGFGMSESWGRVPWPWAIAANAALVLQFPVLHSALLSPWGRRVLPRLVPGPHGGTLATTTFALIAAVQLFLLFAFWTPSGIVWWRAEGAWLAVTLTAYAAAWLLLIVSTFEAGTEVQSGALGWMSLMAGRKPRFPDMAEDGTHRVIRHPIYLSFALTTWTVPVWTPDQLALALCLTAYCLAAPKRKEARLRARHGDRFDRYAARTPYMIPFARNRHDRDRPQ
jgi:protein-S-isoprenylcysteine O-methyltransferase Ste14